MPPRCDETVFTPALPGEAQKEGISIGITASGTYAGAQPVPRRRSRGICDRIRLK
jgi:hypothetical protein